MGTNEIIRRRALQSGGAAIDWESIARGMLDYTTIFEVPEGFAYNSTKQYAFFDRANLVGSVSIPDGSTDVAEYAFSKTRIESVYVPSSVTAIKYAAFQSISSLKHVHIAGAPTLGGGAFGGCWFLEDFVIEATTPPTISSSSITNATNLIIYVPDASVADYQAASGWSNFASKIKPMSQRPAWGVISLIISYLCGFSAERRAA